MRRDSSRRRWRGPRRGPIAATGTGHRRSPGTSLRAGQTVLAHGAAGAVGTMVTQLAREAGAYVIGTGRAADRQKALDFGAHEFVDLGDDALEDVGGVDLVFDVIGGDIQKRSARLIRPGGTLVTVVGPP